MAAAGPVAASLLAQSAQRLSHQHIPRRQHADHAHERVGCHGTSGAKGNGRRQKGKLIPCSFVDGIQQRRPDRVAAQVLDMQIDQPRLPIGAIP
jgi:hypothetical protein